ncbi:hypothetical protein LEN26_014298 [Aphanomyces euteiches]|nr:hypothetical protein AeMF1_020841 [Aphanomyces euteiches]KAH9107374.1 hypothetical protein LEN26_014298 [Aphanomyces euteiches]KAH9193915.1 hypothetical protein AeNC1_004093 [Aphanomyces euteiches]
MEPSPGKRWTFATSFDSFVQDIELFDAPPDVPVPVVKDKDYVYSGRKSFAVWMDWTEWQAVFTDLFPVDLNLQLSDEMQHAKKLHALAVMAAWRARSDVPVAIEVSAQLAEISCHGHSVLGLAAPGRSMYRSHEELRLLYSATVVRCVNGLVDASQRGAYAQAVSSLALRIGIPLWIVDIRHEAAHTKLPSLPTLQLAAQTLRQWLFDHYWQPQDAALKQRVVRIATALDRHLDHQEPLAALLALDVATLSTLVVPLLVQGHQYGHWATSDGLLMESMSKVAHQMDMARFEEEWLAMGNQTKLLKLVEECQSQWGDFDGWFLVALAREFRRIRPDPEQEVKVVLLTKWMLHLVSNAWTVRGPRLSIAASEALVLLEGGSSSFGDNDNNMVLHYQERVLEALKAVTGDKNVINLSPGDNATTWTKCHSWTPSPIGIQTPFGEVPRHLSLDDKVDEWEAGHMVILRDFPPKETNANGIKAYEASYLAMLSDVIETDKEIAEEIVRKGLTNRHENITEDEVNRLQDEIEIW